MGSEVEGFGEWVEPGEGLRWELYARSSMEYCTHVEVGHFESERMRQPMEARKYWYSSRKVTAHKVSLALRADLETAAAFYLEAE